MKSKKRVLPALLVSLFAGAAAPSASAAQFSNVYVFGDSLSDAGYYRPFLTSLGLPAAVVSQLGRFTTNPGPVWSELVSTYYGVAPAPSNAGNGNIFAQGGARVSLSSTSTPPGGAQRPVSTQIDEYFARTSGTADPNALYAVWAGGNDFLQNSQALAAGTITSAQLQTNVLAAAGAEIQQIARLKAAGARYIMVFGLPDIGATPSSQSQGAAAAGGATAISAGYNTTLFTGLASAGIRVIPVDTFSLFSEVRANATAFGFTNTTGIACGAFPPITTAASPSSQFCLPSNFTAPNANENYLFADGVHPTSAVHAILANFVESLIEGPTQYSLLAEAPLRSQMSHIRTLEGGLANASSGDIGRIGVFAAGDGGKFDIDSSRGNTGMNSSVKAATVGLTTRISEAVTLGVSYGTANGDGSFGLEAGGYRTREQAWSLLGSMRWGGFWGSGVVSISEIDFTDIRRDFNLGRVHRTAIAQTKGSNASAALAAGYDFSIGRLKIGPTVGVTSQNVDVNAFDEVGGGSAGLSIAQQNRKSEVWSVGARASYSLGAWTPWVKVTSDKERRDQERFVTATPQTLIAIGSSYDIPAYRPDTSFVTTSVGLSGLLTDNIALALAWNKVSSRTGIKEDGISGVVSVRF